MNREPTTFEGLRRLKALVAASTRIENAARLAKDASIEVEISGLFPAEVHEGLRTISEDLRAYFRRISDAIGKLP